MKKKIFNFFIIFILVFSIFTPVSANRETLEKNKNYEEIIIIPIENYQDKESFEIEIGNISNYNNNNNELSRNRYGKTILKASVSRSGKTIKTSGSTMGSVKLGAVSIPYTQKNVILRFSNLKEYNMNRGYWLPADLHLGLVGIK
ncbi:hypothetical protein [Peptoniphilus porci]|uniref:Uncharacterized protein n=1 Tax=Peptoniphilus porci TaxID=2652280 RepID=A0A1U7LZ97_9FIRM|nr:hypothetical protein [Peptoniphilus porci]OLR64616.1 hypothetical protein BIV18_03230 [Peptoniphilus porci]